MAGHEGGGSSHAGHDGHKIAKVGRVNRDGKMHSYPAPEGWPTSIAFDARDQAWVTLLVPDGKGDKPRGRLARLSRGTANGKSPPPGTTAARATWRGCRTAGWPSPTIARFVLGRVAAGGSCASKAAGEYLHSADGGCAGRHAMVLRRREGAAGTDRPARRGRYLDRPDNGDQTMAMLVTREGDVVFSEFYNYNINRLKKTGEYVEHLVNIDERKGVREVKEGEVCYVQFGARIAAKAEMDAKRAGGEVRNGRFKPDGQGTEKLVEQKCLVCPTIPGTAPALAPQRLDAKPQTHARLPRPARRRGADGRGNDPSGALF